jgi:predicted secreted acid phosphatase
MLPVLFCDIDETICTEFNCPVEPAVRVLRRLKGAVEVFYVSARPQASRGSTQNFLEKQGLPTTKNLHLCPDGWSTLRHKTETMKKVAASRKVLLSVGDSDEDQRAASAAGVKFLQVDPRRFEESWRQIEAALQAR